MDGSPAVAGLPALLLLADGRFPAGSHAHSGGLEAAVAAGRVHDPGTLEAFLRGRVATTGLVSAAFAAAACAAACAAVDPAAEDVSAHRGPGKDGPGPVLAELDRELDARTPAPALRATSRTLGRQLLRAARAVRPHPGLELLVGAGPHQPIVLGVTAHAFGLGPSAAATASLHDAATGPATAAIRLLALDPFAVHAVLARLAARLAELAGEAAGYAGVPADRLPAGSAPILDISAQHHAHWEVRLFAS